MRPIWWCLCTGCKISFKINRSEIFVRDTKCYSSQRSYLRYFCFCKLKTEQKQACIYIIQTFLGFRLKCTTIWFGHLVRHNNFVNLPALGFGGELIYDDSHSAEKSMQKVPSFESTNEEKHYNLRPRKILPFISLPSANSLKPGCVLVFRWSWVVSQEDALRQYSRIVQLCWERQTRYLASQVLRKRCAAWGDMSVKGAAVTSMGVVCLVEVVHPRASRQWIQFFVGVIVLLRISPHTALAAWARDPLILFSLLFRNGFEGDFLRESRFGFEYDVQCSVDAQRR